MADKYHISPSTGNPNKCYASVKPCPLGGESDHYPTKEAARNAYEKSQSEGGQTVTKLRKSAAPAETSGKLASVTTLGGKTRTPAMTEGYNSALPNLGYQTPPLSQVEKKILADVGEGKNVSDEKLDSMIDRLRWAGTTGSYGRPGEAEAGAEVLSYLKAVRSRSSAPSTLPTAVTFDPATQTLFSNADARKRPSAMANSLSRTAKHMEWMEKLASDSRSLAHAPDNTPEERQRYLNDAARRSDEAKRTEAKLHAQFREAQWCFDNNPEWRRNANFGVVRHLNNGMYREAAGEYRDIPIDGVKKAR